MIVKMVLFFAIIALALFFAYTNIENKSNISLIFYEFKNVPVFISLFIAFALGAIFAVPLFWLRGLRAFFKKKNKSKKTAKTVTKTNKAKDDALTDPQRKAGEEIEKKEKPQGGLLT